MSILLLLKAREGLTAKKVQVRHPKTGKIYQKTVWVRSGEEKSGGEKKEKGAVSDIKESIKKLPTSTRKFAARISNYKDGMDGTYHWDSRTNGAHLSRLKDEGFVTIRKYNEGRDGTVEMADVTSTDKGKALMDYYSNEREETLKRYNALGQSKKG